MPSTPPADSAAEVFSGETLEEAMAAAVAAHGADVVVLRARRVRAGMRGLLGRERYEVVTGGPRTAARPAGGHLDPVEAALAALLDDADAQESERPTPRPRFVPAEPPAASRPAAPPRPPAQHRPSTEPPAPPSRAAEPAAPSRDVPPVPPRDLPTAAPVARELPVDDRPAPEPPAAAPARPRAVPPRREGEPVVLEGETLPGPGRSSAWRPRTRPQRGPEVAPHPQPAVADHGAAGVRAWSRTGLRRLGVPATVLAHLPEDDPTDDLAWLVALTGAISACVPAPTAADASNPVVVDGHELSGAVAILDLCCRGAAAPGTLTTAGRCVPATATELALLVRHHLMSD